MDSSSASLKHTDNINEEYFTKLNSLIKNIELNLKNCNKKYKNKLEIDELYSSLTQFLSKENLNDSKLYDELTYIEKDFRRSNSLNETTRKKFVDYKERVKHLNTELKSMKTMLDKSSSSWDKFNESYDQIEQWLDEQECKNEVTSDDLSQYQRYQRIHTQFNDSANFLLQISEQSSCSEIKEKLLYINKLWKSFQDKFKDTNLEQCLKLYECEHSLVMCKERLAKIENLINKNCKCSLNSVSKYQEEVQKACNDLECLDANLKLISKLSQRIDLRQSKEKLVEFTNEIRNTETRLAQLKNFMPEYLKKLTQIYSHISSIENGLQNIEYWVIEGENLVRNEPDQLNFDQISKHIEKQKKHFQDLNYHESSITNKTSLLQTIKDLSTQNFDLTDLSSKINKIKDLVYNLNSKRQKWEELFQKQQALWRAFHTKTKQLEEWIMRAQVIVTEKNDDYNFLIRKHKDFFDNINNEILHGFLSAGEKLLRIKNEHDKSEIKTLMDTLEGQWRMIMSHAPARLLKLQFKRLELLLRQEIKDADAEINEEFNALNENRDFNEILQRHEAKFKNSDFFTTCESYLQGLKTCTRELSDKKVEDKTIIEDAFDSLQSYWISLTQKIENLNAKLSVGPDLRDNFDASLNVIVSWLRDIEINASYLFDYNLSSTSEYKRVLDRIRTLLNEFESKQSLFNTTLTQHDYFLASKNINLNDTTNNLVHNLKQKFTKLITDFPKLQSRSNYLDLILKISTKIDSISTKIRHLSSTSTRRFMSEEDDSSLQAAVEDQKSILDQMRLFEKEIDELKHEAKSLSTDDHLQIPTIVYEKLNCVQESIRHSISEELERRSSLLEIKQSQDQKQTKIDALSQNLQLIETILSNKDPNKSLNPKKSNRKVSFIKSNDNSLENHFNSSKIIQDDEPDLPEDNLKQKQYSKYLNKLSTCKSVITSSRRLLDDMKLPLVSLSSSISSHRAQTPSNFDFQQLRDIEHKLDSYETDIDLQIDIFEQNLARQVKIDKNLEELSLKLTNIIERFNNCYTDPDSSDQEIDIKKSISILENEQERGKIDIEQLDLLKLELNQILKEKRELLEDDNRNLNRSRIGSLLEGFNETIFELDLQKDQELNSKLNQFIIDMNLVEEKCKIKLNEIKYKLDQQSITKKQKKLNLLRDTLDLQLDTLVSLNKFKNEDIKEEDETETEFEDLRKESENILLDRAFSFNESSYFMNNNNNNNNNNNKNEIILTIENEKITEETNIEPSEENSEHYEEVSEYLDIKVVHETTSKKVVTTTKTTTRNEEETKTVSINEASDERIEDITVDYVVQDWPDVITNEETFIEEDIIERETEILQRELHEQEEWNRVQRIEKEREEHLRLEKAEIERIRTERQDRERLELERIERELEEADRQLGIKKRMQEEAEIQAELNRQRQVELEILENEERRKKCEELEKENFRNQEKLKLELKLKEICDCLNNLKEKINTIQNEDLIQSYQTNLNNLDSELIHLSNSESRSLNSSISETYFYDPIDQATQTQFELIRSFISYLNTQLDSKKRDFMLKKEMKQQHSDYERNLDKYVQLALKFITSNSNETTSVYVQSINDLENRIESIESIEVSIQACFRQIEDLNKGLNGTPEGFSAKRSDIEIKILQPLIMNLSRLKQYLSQWKLFDMKFTELRQFLTTSVNLEELMEVKRRDFSSELNLNFEDEFERFSRLRENLVRKLSESDDLFILGSNLFNLSHGQQPCVLAPNASKEFNETRDVINDASQFLDEKCAILNFVCKERTKLIGLDLDLSRLKSEIENTVLDKDSRLVSVNDKIALFKSKLDRLSDLKKRLRVINEEKDRNDFVDCFSHGDKFSLNMGQQYQHGQQSSVLNSKLQDLSRKFNVNLRDKLDDSVQFTMDRLTCLETEYHQTIMINLPSRNSISELEDWLSMSLEKLEILEMDMDNDKSINIEKLESYKKSLINLHDEMLNERELELKFILDSIEKEVKQGFYDLSISDKSAQLENHWNRFKQKLNSTLERVEISLLKLHEFNRSTTNLQTWIHTRNKQNEYETFTKFKPNQNDSTLLMDDFTFTINLNQIEDEKSIIKQTLNFHQLLNDLKSHWDNDKIANDPLIKNLVQYHIYTNLNQFRTQLENIETINKIKIENNLTQLKHDFSNRINELNSTLQDEINFIQHGKLSSYSQYNSAIQKLKEILLKIEETRTEMKQNLTKFELDLKSNDLNTVLNQSGFLNNPHLKHSILNNLTNRELENTAKTLIYQAEQDLIDIWRKYDDLFKSLSLRLDQTHDSITVDLVNLDSIINSENLISKSNLFEQTLSDMIKNKTLFETLESLSEALLLKLSMNENLRTELSAKKLSLREKFKDLSLLADKLSVKLETASREHKNFLSLVDSTREMIAQANKIIIEYQSRDLSNQNYHDLKQCVEEIESSELSLKERVAVFKGLNIKDSERISKLCDLTSNCTALMAKQRDLRLLVIDQIQERNYLYDIKLNDLESFLNSYMNYVGSQFSIGVHSDTTDPNLLEKYINCVKYMLGNELELSKCEKQLDQLEIEINKGKQVEKLAELRLRLIKYRKQIKILTLREGLFDKLMKLGDLKLKIGDIDLKCVEESTLISLKEDFVALRFSLEKLINNMEEDDLGLLNFEIFKINCLNRIEASLNNLINEFLSLSDLNTKYKSQSQKVDVYLSNLEAKFTNSVDEKEDMHSLELRLKYFRDLKVYLTSENLKLELDLLENLASKLGNMNDFQSKRIRQLDLLCDIDKSIKRIDFELSYLKKIVDKSQKLLELIKESHKLLASVNLTSSGCSGHEEELTRDDTIDFNVKLRNDKNLNQLLDFLRFNIMEKLNENESVKNEILDLYSKCLTSNPSESKSDLIKNVIDQLLFEWNLLNEKCVAKIKKFELFKTRLNDLDLKLGQIREYCCSLESYVENEMFKGFDLTNLKHIMAKKSELEKLYDCLKRKDSNTESVLKTCLSANKSYFSSNKQNLFLIINLKDRWSNLKLMLKDKLFKLSNVWLFLCDLNDQIETFYSVLEKTECFYKNALITLNTSSSQIKNFESKNSSFFGLIEELYSTISQDYKLIKYLNESFVNFSKFVYNFESTDCLNRLKKKLLDINSRWDSLHNEIAIKLKLARKAKNSFKKPMELPFRDRIYSWLNEVNLMITNLEHLSTNELQLKSNEIQDLKNEIYDQSDQLYKNENRLKIENNLVDRMRDVMKRILRLDSYIQQSSINPLFSSRSYSSVGNTPLVCPPLFFDFKNYN